MSQREGEGLNVDDPVRMLWGSGRAAQGAQTSLLWEHQEVMRLFLGLTGVVAAIGMAVPAQADTNDDQFLAALGQAGLTYPDPGRAVAAGKAVCNLVDQGKSAAEVVQDIQSVNPGLHGDSAARFTAIAANVYCPKVLKSDQGGNGGTG